MSGWLMAGAWLAAVILFCAVYARFMNHIKPRD